MAAGPQGGEDIPGKPDILAKAQLIAHRGPASQTGEVNPRVEKKALCQRFCERIVEL